uniref:Very-long-chain (3R)-3-hydroxyacyl-CoA dehydratase n=1 Tax=Meloidogyne javanica TaxID=6303 RepID=A0A915LCL7_MELJA
MFEFLKCWFAAICKFIEETVRLQGYGAIPYLMAINSLFCFVCFYASREVQLRVLYSLVGSILVKDLLLTKKRQHPILVVLSWCFADVFRMG